jgi:fluoride exporter
MNQLLLVCLGGAVGSGARYLVAIWSVARYGPGFPYGTLAVNVIGSFLLAILFQLSRSAAWLSPNVNLALGTGVMGGFTTYSTFTLDMIRFVEEGQPRAAVVYGAASLTLCLAAGFVGVYVARFSFGK